MPLNKPHLKDGLADWLDAYTYRNNGFSSKRFMEIMGYDISDEAKVKAIMDASRQGRAWVKRVLEQYRVETKL